MSTSSCTSATRDTVSLLIVDDNAAKRMALRAVLRPLGHRIVEADSGVAALRCLMEEDFAVILLDVRMPIMDGFQTAALVRQRERSEMTPIIFVTAYRSDELLTTERYAEGAVDFMYAPVDPDELRSKVTVLAKLFARHEELEEQMALMGSGGEQLKQLIDVAPIGIFRTDAEGRIVYVNSTFSDITNVPSASALGQEWTELVHTEVALQLQCEDADADADAEQRLLVRHPGLPITNYNVSSRVIETARGVVSGSISVVVEQHPDLSVAQVKCNAQQIVEMSDRLLTSDLSKDQRQQVAAIRRAGDALDDACPPDVAHAGRHGLTLVTGAEGS